MNTRVRLFAPAARYTPSYAASSRKRAFSSALGLHRCTCNGQQTKLLGSAELYLLALSGPGMLEPSGMLVQVTWSTR